MMGLLNPGDEVLIPDPMWLHYFYCARLAGARVASIPLSESDGYQLNPDDIEKRITPNTRMIVVNTPHNPTGVVYTRETLEAVANIAAKHNLIVLSDEIYERIIFDGQEHISMATFPQIAGQVVTVNGFSKSYAMTGWRLGYVVAPPDITKMLIRVHQYTTVCATSFAQAGATAALTGPQESIDMMVGKFDERRKVIIDTFAQMPGAGLVKPTGAFYTFPNLSAIDPSSEVIAQKLLAATGVAVVPGSAFGEAGEGHVRLAYSASLQNVTDGMAALKDYWLKNVVGHA
jgi:aspartate/methionine/tyrosine aminotransferase